MAEEKFKNWHEWIDGWTRNVDVHNTDDVFRTWKPAYIDDYFYEHFDAPGWYTPKSPRLIDVHYAKEWADYIRPLIAQKYEIVKQKGGRNVNIKTVVRLIGCQDAVTTNMTFYVHKQPGQFNSDIRKDIFGMLKQNPIKDVNFNLDFYDKYLAGVKNNKYYTYPHACKTGMRHDIDRETLDEVGFDNICGVTINWHFHVNAFEWRNTRECLYIYGETK